MAEGAGSRSRAGQGSGEVRSPDVRLGPSGRSSPVDDDGFRRRLEEAGPSRPLDFRRKTIDADFVSRLREMAPKDAGGRPILRSAKFGEATFVEPVSFAGVVFRDDVSFDKSVFKGDVSFEGAVFEGHARFGLSTFEGRADFARSRFGAHGWFSGTSFAGQADFEEAAFGSAGWFGSATFASDASFAESRFAADANFDQATFGCHTAFASGRFDGEFSIVGATFKHEPGYQGARFKGPSGAPKVATRQVEWAGAPLAPWSSRATAALYDLAVPAGLVLAALVLAFAMRGLSYTGLAPLLVGVALVAGAVLTVRNLIYQGHTGQSYGKRKVGLSLVRQVDGMPVGVNASLVRAGLHAVDTLPLFLGWLAPLWSKRHQTFADRIATTVVVQQKGWAGAAPSREVPNLAAGRPASGYG